MTAGASPAPASGRSAAPAEPGGRRAVLRRFARFVVAGAFNAGTCVLFSYLLSLVLSPPTLAFALGYGLSLTLSYFVNAYFVFDDPALSLAKFARFCLSYVPNFLIQIVLVQLLISRLHLEPVAAYALGVVSAVPLTFAILSVFTFRRRSA